MYIFLGALILAIFFHFIGRLWLDIFPRVSYKHPLVYGFLFYMIPFFAISMVSMFLHLSWNFFAIAISSLNLLYLFAIIYAIITKKIIVNVNMSVCKKYVQENYVLLFTILFCFIVSALSSVTKVANIEWGYPTTDNMTYLSKAVKAIGNPALATTVTGWTFNYAEVDALGLVAWWELFWAYWTWLTGMNVLVLVFSGIGLLSYIVILSTIDEAIYLLSGKKKQSKYIILSILYIYLISQNHHEFSKFMLVPWFGNVFTTIWALPMFAILLKHANKSLVYLLLIPLLGILGNGFSPGMATVVAFTFPFFAWFLFKNQKDNSKMLERIIILGIFLMGISFFIVMAYFNVSTYGGLSFDSKTISWFAEAQGELNGGIFSLMKKLVIVVVGIICMLLLPKKYKQEPGRTFSIFIYSLFGIFLFHPLAEFFSYLFAFSYRRVTEAVGLMALVVSFYYIVELARCHIKDSKKIWILLFAFLVVMRPDSYLLIEKRQFMSISNLTDLDRVGDAATETYRFFDNMNIEKNVCFFPSRYYSNNDNIENFSEIGTSVLSSKQVYMGCSEVGLKEGIPNYVVLGVNDIVDIDLVERLFVENNAILEKVISDERITLKIYRVNDTVMREFFITGEKYRKHCEVPDENGVCERRLV